MSHVLGATICLQMPTSLVTILFFLISCPQALWVSKGLGVIQQTTSPVALAWPALQSPLQPLASSSRSKAGLRQGLHWGCMPLLPVRAPAVVPFVTALVSLGVVSTYLTVCLISA